MEFEAEPQANRHGAIFAAMAAVKRIAADEGIAKDREGKGYNFRGIDDVQNFFARPLADNGILVTTSTTDLKREIQKTTNSQVISVTVTCHYNFVSLEDGSSITVGPYMGEATDSLDKATSKATSVAYRNMMLLTFSVPLGPGFDPEGWDDEDAEAGDNNGDDRQERQPQPQRRDEQRAAPQREQRQASNRAQGGALADPLPQAKQRLIDNLMRRHNVSEADIARQFRGGVNTANFNEVMDWLKKGAGQ